MTEDDIKAYLRDKGCADSVWQAGSHGLTQRWNNFVAEIENGYCHDCLIYEYWNDLDTRELIHEVGCEDQVKDADTRFAAMLTATHIKHYKKSRNTDYDFWNFGYPKNATGFFLEEIRRYLVPES
jgi:hypothetical protein